MSECGDVFERNMGYHGNDLIIMWDVDNNDACRLLCGNDPVCSHWGFRLLSVKIEMLT